MNVLLAVLKPVASVAGKALIGALLKLATEKFAIDLIIAIGDFLVKKTSNKLDDEVMAKVKESLK